MSRHLQLKVALVLALVVTNPVAGHAEDEIAEPVLLGLQWGANQGHESDACKAIYRQDGKDVLTPVQFRISPYEAIKLAEARLGFSCRHKWGAQIYASSTHYFIARAGNLSRAIVIDGITGELVSEGFHRR